MCGFTGCLRETPGAQFTDIKKMNQTIVHRGPDDSGYFADDYITMGFRRLSIIDLTEAGHQPMPYLEGRYMLTFNGEIYNYVELRDQLKARGYQFRGDSDSEVLVAAYAEYGVEAPKHFRGMFAFVIWDTQEHTMFAARDHFGIKPFYYAQEDDQLLYASEQKALYAVMQQPTLNQAALQDYFTYQYVPEPKTMATEIEALKPGHWLLKKPGQPAQVKRYYDPTFAPIQQDEDTVARQLQEVLIDSVKIHMRSDVPVGAFLSGGIDSTIIASIAKQFNPRLETFSVGFEREGYSELDVATETAEALGVENFQQIITPEDFMAGFNDFVWAMDDPLADPAAVPQFFLAKLTRKRVTVALTGEGADELFGGYPIYHEPLSLAPFCYTKPINWALKLIGKAMPEGMRGKSFLLRGTTPLEKRYVGDAYIFNEAEKAQFLTNYDPNQPATDAVAEYYRDAAGYDPMTKMQYVDMHAWLNGDLLRNGDRTSMDASLELRTPFLDREVMKVAGLIPSDLRIKDGQQKYILRKAVADLIPAHVLNRKKLGFPVPIRFWLKDELYDWARDLILHSPTDQYFDKSYFLKLLDDHRAGKGDYSRKLWVIITFMTWYQLYVLHEQVPVVAKKEL